MSAAFHMCGFDNYLIEIVVRLAAMREIAKISQLGTHCSLTGLPFNEVYCASKFAIEGACESLAVLLQQFNIQ